MEKLVAIKEGKFFDTEMKNKEVENFISKLDEINKTVDIYSIEIIPYSFKTTIEEFIKGIRGFSKFTYYSKLVAISELNGLIDIVNRQIDLYYEPNIKIEIIVGKNTGEIKEVKESIAEDFISIGFAKLA